MILTFTEYLAPITFKSGKTGPARWKAGGTDYLVAKGVTVVVGGTYECVVDITHSDDGKFTNHTVKSAVLVTAPVSAPSPGTEAVATPAASNFPQKNTPIRWDSESVRQRLIVRQSSLKAAVELVNGNQGDYDRDISDVDRTLYVADRFTDWVFKEDAYDGAEVNREGDGSHGAAAVPQSPAQQHLESARAIQRDIRSTYADEDAVCPNCGRKEFLKQWNLSWFCAPSKVAGEPGGCGFPPKGDRMDNPVSYGEFKQRTAAQSVPWK